jgi:hypothetical protein
VVKTANMIRRRDHSNSASGPDYFGFSNATIAKLIQDLPNADKCKTYVMQLFEEPSATTGKSTPAGTAPTSPTIEKRKHSVLDSNDQGEEEDDEEEEDDDAYASLGTPGKKKTKRSSSPVIRHAGFEPPMSVDHGEEDGEEGEGDMEGEGEEEEEEEEEEDELDELEGDDNHTVIDIDAKDEPGDEDTEIIEIDDEAPPVQDKDAAMD